MAKLTNDGGFSKRGGSFSDSLNEEVLERVKRGEIDATKVTSKRKTKRTPTRPDITDQGLADIMTVGKQPGRTFNPPKKGWLKRIIASVIILLLLLIGLSYERVTPGYTGIQYDYFDGTTERILWSGTHFTNPFHDVVYYPTSQMPGETITSTNTEDGSNMTLTLNYTYSVSQEDIGAARSLYHFREVDDLKHQLMVPIIKKETSLHVADYASPEDLSASRNDFTELLESDIEAQFSTHNLLFDNLSVTID